MSKPFPIRPGVVYLLTRRVVNRHFWLTPSSKLNQLFWYLFAVGAERYGLQVHGVVVMSSHYHAVVTDPGACIPAFEQWFHAYLALAINSLMERSGSFWGLRTLPRQILADPGAIREKLIYVATNPTAAGLVAHGRDWPGVRSPPEAMLQYVQGKSMTFKRPSFFIDPKGDMPAEVTLSLSVPEMLLKEAEVEAVTAGDAPAGGAPELVAARQRAASAKVVTDIIGRVKAKEEEEAEKLRAEGRSFLGRRHIQRQDRDKRATSPEPHGAKRVRLPIFGTSSRELRDALLLALAEWRRRYAKARKALRAFIRWVGGGGGDQESEDTEPITMPVFPEGTYKLRIELSVPCHPAPS